MKKNTAEITNINLADLDVQELEARLELASACEAACDCTTSNPCPTKCNSLVLGQ